MYAKGMILVAIYLLLVSCANSLKIGVIYSGSGIFSSFGQTVRPITEGWRNYTSSRYFTDIYYCDIRSNVSLVAGCTQNLIDNGVSIIIPGETTLSIPSLPLAAANNIPVISSMAASSDVYFTSSGMRKYNNLFGVMTPAQNYFNTLLPMVYNFNQRTIGIITVSSTPDRDVCDGAAYSADYTHLTVLAKIILTLPDPNNLQLIAAINTLNLLQPDIVIICYRVGCTQTLLEMSSRDYTPNVLAMFECANTLTEATKVAGQFIFTPLQWDSRLTGSDYSDSNTKNYSSMFPYYPSNDRFEDSSAIKFSKWLSSKGIVNPNSLVAPQLAALYVIDAVISSCNCNTSETIIAALSRISVKSFYGLIRFDENGQNTAREMALIQVDINGKQQIISPSTSVTMSPIIPIPKWHERIYKKSFFDYPTEKVILCLCVITLIFLIAIFAITIKFRDNPVVKGTSYPFLLCSLIGWMLTVGAVLSWRLDNNSYDCNARILFIVGPLMVVTPWIAKTIRLFMIFEHNTFVRKNLPHSHILLLTFILASPFLVLTITWFVGMPLELKYIIIDPIRPLYNYYDCGITSKGFEILITIIILFFVYLLIAVSITYKVKNVKATFNDTGAIALSIYMIGIWLGIVLVVHFSLGKNGNNANFIIRSIGIMVCCITSVAIFINNIYTTSYEDDNITIVKSSLKLKANSSKNIPSPEGVSGAETHYVVNQDTTSAQNGISINHMTKHNKSNG